MFAKRSVQKNLKRSHQNEIAKPFNEEDDRVESAGEIAVTMCSASDKRRKVAGAAPLVMTSRQSSKVDDRDNGQYESDPSLGVGKDQRATATASYDTDPAADHRAVLERNEAIGKALLSGDLKEGVYRGIGAYRPAINRREGAVASGKFTGSYGPVRGNQHVRMTMRIDLNPEICKDYKETGYCGYGDSCIFLHDRTDYKSGWQLEKEWEQQQKEKQAKDARKLERNIEGGSDEGDLSSNTDDDDEDSVASACGICKMGWTEVRPQVVTQCRHYFCEQCALGHYATSSRCAICSKPTNGLFNSVTLTKKG